jgi:serine/threonine protein kinase
MNVSREGVECHHPSMSSASTDHDADPNARTNAAAEDVLARAARDGERVVAIARIVLAISTLIAWPIWNWERLKDGVVADWVVISMSMASLAFSIGVLAYLRGDRPDRNTAALRMLSILVDGILIIGGLATFVVNPPPEYVGIAREPGASFALFGVLAGGVRLRVNGAMFSALVFGVGVLALLVVDHSLNPNTPVGASNVLTWGGLWLTASVFAWLFAKRTEAHVREGALNAADEINASRQQLRDLVHLHADDLARIMRAPDEPRSAGELAPGTVIREHFEIERRLAAGGMGAVYVARDRQHQDERVAIKVIRARAHGDDGDAQMRFLAEADAMAKITHEAVVRVIHVGVAEGGALFQAMELIRGENLEEHFARAPLDASMTARLGEVLFDALAAVHACGLVHRDVKPKNIMLTKAARGVKLIDFGIARSLDGDNTQTATGHIVGTWMYMAPEQKAGARPTNKVDVYAAGLVLVRCLTEKMPHDGGLDVVAARAPDLAPLIERCLAERPGDRPSARDLAAALRTIADRLGAARDVTALAPAQDSSSSSNANVAARTPASFRIGEHELEAKLGTRAVGSARETVWRATNKNNKPVAIRILRDADDAACAQGFADAARAAAALSHPNLCTIFDVGVDKSDPYLVMELVGGDTVAALLARGPIAADLASRVLRALDSARAYLAKDGRHFGAWSASNIKIDGDVVKILDVERVTSADDEERAFIALCTQLTSAGQGSALATHPSASSSPV